jgi:tetratricopeptide (TPR) repeat protein
LEEYLNLRAYAYEALGRYEEAIADIERLKPYDDLFNRTKYEWLAILKEHIGDNDGALDELNHAISLESETAPVSYQTFFQRGRVHEKLGQFREAIQDFTAAIELESKHVHADPPVQAMIFHSWRGKAYLALNDLDNAYQDFTYIVSQSGPTIGWTIKVDAQKLIDEINIRKGG